MSTDRFADWGDERPDDPVGWMEEALRAYLAGGVESLGVSRAGDGNGHVVAVLVGKAASSWPRRLVPFWPRSTEMTPGGDSRWFTVEVAAYGIDVQTKLQDEFTRSVADGFLAMVVRVWSMRPRPR